MSATPRPDAPPNLYAVARDISRGPALASPLFELLRAAVSMAESAMSDRADRDKFLEELRRQNRELSDQIADMRQTAADVEVVRTLLNIARLDASRAKKELARLRSPMQEE